MTFARLFAVVGLGASAVIAQVTDAFADEVGQALGEANTRIEACAIARGKAKDATEGARILKHHVEIESCICEEKEEVESINLSSLFPACFEQFA